MKKYILISFVVPLLFSCERSSEDQRTKEAKLKLICNQTIQIILASNNSEGKIDWKKISDLKNSNLFEAISYGSVSNQPALLLLDQQSKVWLFSMRGDGDYIVQEANKENIKHYHRKETILRIEAAALEAMNPHANQ